MKKYLITTHPELITEWDYERNTRDPDKVTYGSDYIAHWECGLPGHNWKMSVYNRTVKGLGCTVCSGRKLVSGVNDLKTKYYGIAYSWHPTLNLEVGPQDVVPNDVRKFAWLCTEGHPYWMSPNKRVQGQGCNVCSGKVVLVGVNDFNTTHPEASKQYHPTKNLGRKRVEEFTAGHNKMYWWICEKGHEWEAYVYNRAKGQNCPECRDNLKTETYLRGILNESVGKSDQRLIDNLKWPHGNRFAVDYVYGGFVVEYDGNWHNNSESLLIDTVKTRRLLDSGYSVVRIRQGKTPLLDIEDSRYLQIAVEWDKHYYNLHTAVQESILPWISKKGRQNDN